MTEIFIQKEISSKRDEGLYFRQNPKFRQKNSRSIHVQKDSSAWNQVTIAN